MSNAIHSAHIVPSVICPVLLAFTGATGHTSSVHILKSSLICRALFSVGVVCLNPTRCVCTLIRFHIRSCLAASATTCSMLVGGDEDEEYEDEDTGASPADAGVPIQTVEGGEVGATGTAQQEPAGQTTNEQPQSAAEAAAVAEAGADVATEAAEGHGAPPGLDDLAIEGTAVAEPEGEDAGEEANQPQKRKKKERRFPHWHSLKA